MLDRSTSHPASMFRAPRRSARAETFVDLVTIELSGHDGCGASFDCEVEFTREPSRPGPTATRAIAFRRRVARSKSRRCGPTSRTSSRRRAAEARRANTCRARNGSRNC